MQNRTLRGKCRTKAGRKMQNTTGREQWAGEKCRTGGWEKNAEQRLGGKLQTSGLEKNAEQGAGRKMQNRRLGGKIADQGTARPCDLPSQREDVHEQRT
jgi:hypothetical protein